jgi:hypothetical protein
MATQTFDTWLNTQMTNRGVKSARRLGMEAGLDPSHVSDWLLGASVPNDQECDVLATYFSVNVEEVKERRFPGRRR